METILFVDDEPNVIVSFRRQLRGEYNVLGTSHPSEALSILSQNRDVAVIVSDMQMPEINGITLLRQVSEKHTDIVRVILTGNNDQETVVRAINEGDVFRFLNKPCSTEQMLKILSDCLAQRRMIVAEKELLQNTLSGTIKLLTDLHDMMDPEGHQQDEKIRERVRAIAKQLSIKSTLNLELASLLCNIGKLAIPPELLTKEKLGTPLTTEEKEVLGRYPETGSSLIKRIPRLESVAEIIQHHRRSFAQGHENPEKKFPIGANILRAAQDFEHAISKGMAPLAIVDFMKRSIPLYEQSVVAALEALFSTPVQAPLSETVDYEIDLAGLFPGQILTREVKTLTGTLLLSKGFMVTPAVIAKLKNYQNIYGIALPLYVNALIPTRQ